VSADVVEKEPLYEETGVGGEGTKKREITRRVPKKKQYSFPTARGSVEESGRNRGAKGAGGGGGEEGGMEPQGGKMSYLIELGVRRWVGLVKS